MSAARVFAYFQPQAWINDNAIDIDGARVFEITDQVLALGRAASLAIEDNDYPADALWITYRAEHPAEAMTNHSGPFSIHCAQAIAVFWASRP